MKGRNFLLLAVGVVFFLMIWYFRNESILTQTKNTLPQVTEINPGGANNTNRELLRDIYISSKINSGNISANTGSIIGKDIVGTIENPLMTPVYGSGFAISGTTVYGDKKEVLVLSDGRIIVGYEPWEAAKNWKEIYAPKGWGLDKDTIMRRFYYYSVGISDADYKKLTENVQLRYKVMYSLIHNENQDDIFVKQGKECLTELGKSYEYTNVPADSIFKICKPTVPEGKHFSSEKDLSFGRYAYSVIYKASQNPDIKVCDTLSEVTFDKKTYSSQFSLGEYYLICRGVIDGGKQKILDYLYGFTLMSGISNRCELYDKEGGIRSICESITDTLK